MSYHKSGNDRRKEWKKSRHFGHSSTQKPRFKHESHPPELQGREIGLWYKNQSSGQRDQNINGCSSINIPDEIRTEIESLLKQVDLPDVQIETNNENLEQRYSEIIESSFKKNFLKAISITLNDKLEILSQNTNEVPTNSDLDSRFKLDLESKLNSSSKYQKMLEFREKLPVFKYKQTIIEHLEKNQVVVVSGETGCGKTTQISQFILDDYILNKNRGSSCNIICTQPRRISAISVAERVATERDEKCGENSSVGYQVRLDKKLPRQNGSILYCTTGILLQQMQNNPSLKGISHLLIDEVHERDVNCDFTISLIKQIILKRPSLRVILMSATLNSEKFSQYFNNCPIISIPGFTYPVTEYYLEDVLKLVPHSFPPYKKLEIDGSKWKRHTRRFKESMAKENIFVDFVEPYARSLEASLQYPKHVINNIRNPNSERLDLDLVHGLIKYICLNTEDGAILVFLPGFSDISKLNVSLNKDSLFNRAKYKIIALHSKMATVFQAEVFKRPPSGVRKIIIATNIAETSITIDDVVYVVDSGKIKRSDFDVDDNIETLETTWVSLANAHQRRGRAGRVQPGVCYHLFTKARHMTLPQYEEPEILRCRLDDVVLKIKFLQLGKTDTFLNTMMNPPNPKAIEHALNLLTKINALDTNEQLTPLGYHLAQLPINPQCGKMILMGALFGCVHPILVVAASLSFKDPFLLVVGKEKETDRCKREMSKGSQSDQLTIIEAYQQWEIAKSKHQERQFCWNNFLSEHILRQLQDMVKDLAQHLYDMEFLPSQNCKDPICNRYSSNKSLLKAVVCAGLYPNVASIRIKKFGIEGFTLDGKKCAMFVSSVLANERYFKAKHLVFHKQIKSSCLFLHDNTPAFPLPLLFFGDTLTQQMDEGHETIAVNSLIKFKCDDSSAQTIINLRKYFNRLLMYKISHPGYVDWNEKNSETAVLECILRLITLEETGQLSFS